MGVVVETRKGIRHLLMTHKLLHLLMFRQLRKVVRNTIKKLRKNKPKPPQKVPRSVAKALKIPCSHCPLACQACPLCHSGTCRKTISSMSKVIRVQKSEAGLGLKTLGI